MVFWNGNSWDQSGINIGLDDVVNAIVMNGTQGYVGGDGVGEGVGAGVGGGRPEIIFF